MLNPVLIAAFAGTVYAVTASVRWYLTVRASQDDPVAEPPGRVSLLVPTLNEEDYVVDALRTLREQTLVRAYPDRVEILLVDSASTDATVARAEPYVDRVVEAPRGKLNALQAGVEAATGDVVVEADADGIYPPGWLNLLLEPYRHQRPGEPWPSVGGGSSNPGRPVVGVHAPFLYYDSPLIRFFTPLMRTFLLGLGNFPGGARSYRREAFLRAGGFDTSVDQRSFWDLWLEEEFRFPQRLEAMGRVVFNPRASCFKSARRLDPVLLQDARSQRFRQALGDEDGARFGGAMNRRVKRVVERIQERRGES